MDTKSDLSPQENAALDTTKESLNLLISGRMAILQQFADSQKRKSGRLEAIEKELVKEVGEKDPEVRAVRKEKEQSARFAESIAMAVKQAQSLTLAKDTEQGFAGSVRTTDGEKVQGIHVQLISKSGKTDKKVAEGRTDQFGNYSINVPLCDLNPKAKWILVVQDEQGETLASQPVVIDASANITAFVPLTLQPTELANPGAPNAEEVKPIDAKPVDSKGLKTDKR